MNAFIRHHRKVVHCDSSTQWSFKSCKYDAIRHRPYSTPRYFPKGSLQYFKGGTVVHNYRSLVFANYAPVLATAFTDGVCPGAKPFSQNAIRDFHMGRRLCENTSSKVEATVNKMKEKQKEKVEGIMKEAASALSSTGAAGAKDTPAPAKGAEVLKTAPVKKSLKARIWEELVHYYHGFRLLFIDINVCRKLLWRVLNGKTLSRRENKLLVRTTSDLFRLIPFSVFVIVPFMELLLPVFIKFFPGMLPSTFQTAKERENKLKQSLQVRLEMAKFLQQTLDEMALQHKEHKSEEAKEFAEFFRKIKNPIENVSNDDIIKFAKRFDDEITLDSLSRDQLAALCRVLELSTMGTSNFLRFQLRVKLRSLAADDRVISREGVESLDLFELQQACKSRGMRAYGLTADRLREQLQEWIDLSLNEKVPPTLLLLSRAVLVSDDTTTTTEKLKETIRVLPNSVAAQTKAAIGEREGKIDNKTKIEVIKEEERKIKEEREEEREEEKAKAEILLDKAPEIKVDETIALGPPAEQEELSQRAKRTAPVTKDEKKISSKDVELLGEALKSLSSDTKQMQVEKETIKDLKEELEDYKEDLEELHEVRNVVQEPVQESRAAKMLFKKVNNMIGQLDKVLADLEKQQQKIKSTFPVDSKAAAAAVEAKPEVVVPNRKDDEIVRIDDLMSTIKQLKQTSDDTRLNAIGSVLSKLDADKDGVITVDEVLKVVEAISRDNVHLDEKQIEEVLTLLNKEQLIQAEEKIEKALAKSLKEVENIKAKKQEESQKRIDAVMAAMDEELAKNELRDDAVELKDKAPGIKDKATNLDALDKKNTAKIESASDSCRGITDSRSREERVEKSHELGKNIAGKPNEKIMSPKTDVTQSIPPTPPISSKVNPKDKVL